MVKVTDTILQIEYVGNGALVLMSAIATFTDIKYGRIPNWLTLPGIIIGLILGILTNGLMGLVASLGSIALAGGVYLVLFIFGGMGAGAVKMMAAVAAIASWPTAIYILMYSIGAFAIEAASIFIFRGRLAKTNKRWFAGEPTPDDKEKGGSQPTGGDSNEIKSSKEISESADSLVVPCGPCIAIGTLIAMIS